MKINFVLCVIKFKLLITISIININAASVKPELIVAKHNDLNYYDRYFYILNGVNENFVKSKLTVIKQDDPDDNYKDTTYDFLNFIDEITTSEVNLATGPCTTSCSSYTNNRQISNTDLIHNYNASCTGRIRNCILYKEPLLSTSDRDLIGFNNFFELAVTKDAESFLNNIALSRQTPCPFCKCYCDNSKNSTYTSSICLDAVSSNVAEGYIVTGIRFKIVEKIVRVQIQQGKLLDDKIIDASTLKWQALDDCKVNITLDFDHRTMQLDDVVLPEGLIVTGVSLSRDKQWKRIFLSVHGKEVGQLKNVNIEPTEYRRLFEDRINLMTTDMEIPTSCNGKNTELSKPDKHYVTFQPPNLRSDADVIANQIMPFFDIRKVAVGNYMKALKGLGIYWRGQRGCGGYVAFKLFV